MKKQPQFSQNAESLVAVHTHTHTHTCSFKRKELRRFYVLLILSKR